MVENELSILSVEKEEKNVKKHPAIIHCSNTLSLLQRKISNALLFHAYKDLLTQEEYELSIAQLCHLICYYGKNYDVIKNALRGMIMTLIEWNLTDEKTGEEDWTASAILASVRIKKGKIIYAYSPRMRHLLYSPSMYAKINLLIQSRFRSNYGLALYENCVRYKGLASTKWFEMSLFRRLMGVPDDKYVIFRDFKRRVLDKAVEEINALSDIIVTPEIQKERSRVAKIRFILRERAKKKRFSIKSPSAEEPEIFTKELPTNEHAILEKLKANYAIMQPVAIKLVKQYGTKAIEEKMTQIESSSSYLAGKINALGGYLIDALKNDYTISNTSQDLMNKQKKEKEEERMKARLEESRVDQYKKEYSSYVTQLIDDKLAMLAIKNKKLITEIQQSFEESLQDAFTLNRYRKQGLSDRIVKAIYNQFLIKNHSDLFGKIPSFEMFLQAKKP